MITDGVQIIPRRVARTRPDPVGTAEAREKIRNLAAEISALMTSLDEGSLRWVLIAPPTDSKPVQFIYEV